MYVAKTSIELKICISMQFSTHAGLYRHDKQLQPTYTQTNIPIEYKSNRFGTFAFKAVVIQQLDEVHSYNSNSNS